MAKSKQEIKKQSKSIKNIDKEKNLTKHDDTTVAGIEITALMPELEELVKKNPNRLVGCGG